MSWSLGMDLLPSIWGIWNLKSPHMLLVWWNLATRLPPFPVGIIRVWMRKVALSYIFHQLLGHQTPFSPQSWCMSIFRVLFRDWLAQKSPQPPPCAALSIVYTSILGLLFYFAEAAHSPQWTWGAVLFSHLYSCYAPYLRSSWYALRGALSSPSPPIWLQMLVIIRHC